MPGGPKNLLHFCSEAKEFQLFNEICSSSCLDKEDIIESLNANNSPLNQITDDDCLEKIIDKFGASSFSAETQLQITRTICKHNLIKSLEFMQYNTIPKQMIEFIKSKNENNQNALMIAAESTSDKVLMVLITSTFLNPNCPQTEKDLLLHDKDQHGQSVLTIIMSQGESLTFAREMMIKIERDFHRDGSKITLVPLVKCFQNKLGPSREVAKALKDEQAYLTPSMGKKTAWFLVFLQFLIPFVIFIQDVVTDILLSKQYYAEMHNDDSLTNAIQCDKECNQSIKNFIEELDNFPRDLKAYPCFNYSVAFLLMPIICYSSEWYLHKSHSLRRKVSTKSFNKSKLKYFFSKADRYWIEL